jgi:small GTP-binding protein
MINKNIKKTGIPTLDEYLKGGIPIGKTLLYFASPFVESDVFVMQTVYTNLAADEVCYYVASNCSPEVARAAFREYGWDTDAFARRFEIVDAYSALVGASPTERLHVRDPENIESIDETFSLVIDMLSPGDMVVFPSLSSIFDNCMNGPGGAEAVLKCALKWNKMAALKGGVVVYNFNDRGYDQALLEQVKSGLCNATVLVGGLGADMIYGQYFQLFTCDWARPGERPTLFKIVKPGGVAAHIPKILVTGPQGCGKSTFVRTSASLSSGKCISVDRMGTTVAGDHAHVMIKGFSMDIFGTPGQKRFNSTLRSFAEDAMGIVLVIDSADPRNFEDAAEMLKIANMGGVPYLIAANKQDARGAMSTDKIRKKMEVPDEVPVVAINAMNAGDVMSTLELLIGKIVGVRTRSGEVGRFNTIIDDLRRTRGVRAAAIVSVGGVLKAASIPGGVQGERLAAMAATMQNMAASASESLNQGRMDRLVVEIDDSRLVVVNAGERNMLLVLAESRENPGFISAGMNEAVRRIKEVLGEGA